MSRRVSLPAADDLFRPTADPAVDAAPQTAAATESRSATRKTPSGRVRHDEKMTVYITSEELLEIEHARLALRHQLGVAVDRGRLVREAVALVLADFDAHGDDSVIVRRLRGE
ncbi:hypothetical protein [Nocardioides limicola]|uniref:hypothetical protein n=1 Tax=Nocardioides limicola TaxID=2803368 RepID=UPI00193C030A|nr:hypothetical protein [Nocardioides sp. DJM-14]